MVDAPEYEQSKVAIVELDRYTKEIAKWIEFSLAHTGDGLNEDEMVHLRDLREALVEATRIGWRDSINETVAAMPETVRRQGDRALRVAADLHRRRLAEHQRDVLRPALASLLRDNGRFRKEAVWAFRPYTPLSPQGAAEALAAVAPGVLEQIDIQLRAESSTYQEYRPYSSTVRALDEAPNAIMAAISVLRVYSDQLAEGRAAQLAAIEVARGLRGALGQAFSTWMNHCLVNIDWALGRDADDAEAALFGLDSASSPTSTLAEYSLFNSNQYLLDSIAGGGDEGRQALLHLRARMDEDYNPASWNITVRDGDRYVTFGLREFDRLVRATLEKNWATVKSLIDDQTPGGFAAALSHLPETSDWLARTHGILLEDSQQSIAPELSEDATSYVAWLLDEVESEWTLAGARARAKVAAVDHVITLVMGDEDLRGRWSGRRPDEESVFHNHTIFGQAEPPSPPPLPDLAAARDLAKIAVAEGDEATIHSLVRLLGDFSARAPGYISPEPTTSRYLTSIDLFLDADGVAEGFARLVGNGGLDLQAAQIVAGRAQGWRVAERLVVAHPEILDHSALNAMPEQRGDLFRTFVRRLEREFTHPADHATREPVSRHIVTSLLAARDGADREAGVARMRAEFADGLAVGLHNECLPGDWYEQPAIVARVQRAAESTGPNLEPPSLDRVDQLARELLEARSATLENRRIAEAIDVSVAQRVARVEPGSAQARAFLAQHAELSAKQGVGSLLPSVTLAAQRLLGPDDLGPAQPNPGGPDRTDDGSHGGRLEEPADAIHAGGSGAPEIEATRDEAQGSDAGAHRRSVLRDCRKITRRSGDFEPTASGLTKTVPPQKAA